MGKNIANMKFIKQNVQYLTFYTLNLIIIFLKCWQELGIMMLRLRIPNVCCLKNISERVLRDSFRMKTIICSRLGFAQGCPSDLIDIAR